MLPEGSVLVQPNYIYGLVHYALQFFVTLMGDTNLQKTLSLGGIGATFYFSYAMYQLGTICIACVAGHVTNIALYYIDVFSSKPKLKKA